MANFLWNKTKIALSFKPRSLSSFCLYAIVVFYGIIRSIIVILDLGFSAEPAFNMFCHCTTGGPMYDALCSMRAHVNVRQGCAKQ